MSQDKPKQQTISAVLEIRSGPEAGRRIDIPFGKPFRIGRGDDAELTLSEDRMLSRLHFSLRISDQKCLLEDLDSVNGTYVEGRRIREMEMPLSEEHNLRAGDTEFHLYLECQEGTTGAPGVPGGGTMASAVGGARAAREDPFDAVATPELLNRTPLQAQLLPWEDHAGQAQLSVILKATFSLGSDGKIGLADEQQPLLTSDELYEDDPGNIIRLESDLVPFKPRADVILVGWARAPQGQNVTRLQASLKVGALQHHIDVIGDRFWIRGREEETLTISEPIPFQTMELQISRSFGGMEVESGEFYAANPQGSGFIGDPEARSAHGKRLPNLEDPRQRISSYEQRPKPVGLGYFCRGCEPRLTYGMILNGVAEQTGHPPQSGYQFYNGAFPDLQVQGYLSGDEPVELINLAPPERSKFTLAGLSPEISVQRTGWSNTDDQKSSRVESFTPNLDTLLLLPEEGVIFQVYRAVLPLYQWGSEQQISIEVTLPEATG